MICRTSRNIISTTNFFTNDRYSSLDFYYQMAIFCRDMHTICGSKNRRVQFILRGNFTAREKNNFEWILIGGRSKLASRFIFLFIFFVARIHPFCNPRTVEESSIFFYPESIIIPVSDGHDLNPLSKARKNKQSIFIRLYDKFPRFLKFQFAQNSSDPSYKLLKSQDSFLPFFNHFQNSRRIFRIQVPKCFLFCIMYY